MFDKELYWTRRKLGFRGQDPIEPPKLIEGTAVAPLVTVDGVEIYIPRNQRRGIMARFYTDLQKGRIDLKALNEKRLELNRDRNEHGE